MNAMDKYPKLFSPMTIGRMTVKNRVVMAPMGFHSADANGDLNDRSIAAYAERARGGVGLILVGMLTVDEEHGIGIESQFRLRPSFLPNYVKLAEEVHAYGTKIIGQLYHGGAMCIPAVSGHENISPSGVRIYPDRETRAMTIEDIQKLKSQYVEKAKLLQLAGFDGAEIHAAHGYLLPQFLSPYFNKREDEYGGSFENRFRLLREILEEVRAAVGRAFVLTVRFPADEYAQQLSPLHLSREDCARLAQAIEATGTVDALDISYGNAFNANANCEPYSYPSGWKKDATRAIREVTGLPLISTNTIKGPEFAEELLEEGVCDFVAIGRGLLADPHFVIKTWEGREDEIRRCMGCMYCRTSVQSLGLQCAVNPTMLRECTEGEDKLRKNGAGRTVAVVGGGPGGMQAAMTLAKRGFRVTLYEKSDEMGGSMNAADKAPLKDKMTRMIGILTLQTQLAGVHILKNTEATAELVEQIHPEAVFLACGAKPIIPKLPGVDQPNVYLAERVQHDRIPLQGSVAVIGGGMTGMEVAETLEERGCRVTLVEMTGEIGAGMGPQLVMDVRSRMTGTTVLTRHMLTGIDGNTVRCRDLETGGDVEVNADNIVLALGAAPDMDAVRPYYEKFGSMKVFLIGDAEHPGKVYDTVKDAYLKAFHYD